MKSLTLSKNSSIYRWYCSNLNLWLRFTSSTQRIPQYARGDNLCHFMRTCLLYAPTVVVCHLLTAWWVWRCFIWYPSEWYGSREYLWTATKFVGGCSAFIGVIAGLIYSSDWIGKWWTENRSEPRPRVESNVSRLIDAWVESKIHSSVCPPIDFEEEK